ncbi:MAG: hypothetical protein ACRD29_25160 [Acidimicrobiales bacterium]
MPDLANIPWVIVLIGLELPAGLALVDCWNRPPDHFEAGEPDKQAWKRWLIVAVLTVPILVGFLIVTAYYHVVVRRNSPASRG